MGEVSPTLHRALKLSLAATLPFALGVALSPRDSHAAGLRDDAARVLSDWKKQGAEVTTLPSRFVYQGESFVLELPPNSDALCTNVALVAARGLSFHARFGVHEEEGEEAPSAPSSSAGALGISRCSGQSVTRVSVTNDAGRGAFEIVVAYSRRPLSQLRDILPDRAPPLFALAAEPGARPEPPLARERARVLSTRAIRGGASDVEAVVWPVSDDGTGAAVLDLDPGCHELRIFAPDPPAVARSLVRVDVDAELWDEETGRLLSRDRSDALDAMLHACVGEPLRATAIFAGARFSEGVAVSHETWALPPELPSLWGGAVRGRMAAVMHTRGVSVKGPPIFLAEGGGGTTRMRIPVLPGGCYVTVVSTLEGTAHALSVRVVAGARESRDDAASGVDSAVLSALCVASPNQISAEVEARGVGMAWGLSVFRTRSGSWQ